MKDISQETSFRNVQGKDIFRYANSNPFNKDTDAAKYAAYNAGYDDQEAPADDNLLAAWNQGHENRKTDYRYTLIPPKSKRKGLALFFEKIGFLKQRNATGGLGDIKLKHVVILGAAFYLFYNRKRIAGFFHSVGNAGSSIRY